MPDASFSRPKPRRSRGALSPVAAPLCAATLLWGTACTDGDAPALYGITADELGVERAARVRFEPR